mgnify:CR=1 FL=1
MTKIDVSPELEKLLRQHPEEARAHFSLANLYAYQLDQPDLAKPHYRKVLELDPSHAEAQWELRTLDLQPLGP